MSLSVRMNLSTIDRAEWRCSVMMRIDTLWLVSVSRTSFDVKDELWCEGSFIITNDWRDGVGVDELSEDFVDGFLGLALSWDCVSVSCVDVDEDEEVRGECVWTVTWRTTFCRTIVPLMRGWTESVRLLKKVHLKGVAMIGEDWIVVTPRIMTVWVFRSCHVDSFNLLLSNVGMLSLDVWDYPFRCS